MEQTIQVDSAIGPDNWRTIEQGAHEVQDAIRNAFEFSELSSDPQHTSDKLARTLINKADEVMEQLHEFADAIAEQQEADLRVEAESGDGGE